jgi:hypothetical protein
MRKPQWPFYPGWVIASVVSIPVAFAIEPVVTAQVVRAVGATVYVGGQTHITEDFLILYIAIPLIGLLAGSLQSLLLRRYLPHVTRWMAATLLGWLLCLVAVEIPVFFSITGPPALGGVFIGGSIGLPQWLVLRQRVSHSTLWLLASVLGWGVALLLTDGAISSVPEALAVMLIPPMAASMAWWFLLDKLPQGASNGGHAPSSASMPLGQS